MSFLPQEELDKFSAGMVGETAPEETPQEPIAEAPAAEAAPAQESTPEAAPEAQTQPETPAAAAPSEPEPQPNAAAEAQIQERVNQLLEARLQQIAAMDPKAYEWIYGEKPPNQAQAETAAATPKPPEPQDPVQKKLAELETWKAQVEARDQAATRERAVSAFHDRAVGEMEKRAVYADKTFGNHAQAILATRVSANPRADMAKLADDVAKEFQGIEQAIKDKYIGGKKAVAGRVPAGAGASGGAPPGRPPVNLTLGRGPNGTQAALAAYLRGAAAEG